VAAVLKRTGQNVTRGELLAADPFEFPQLAERKGGFGRAKHRSGRSPPQSVVAAPDAKWSIYRLWPTLRSSPSAAIAQRL
jgi:hypothetical protein